MTYEKPNHGDDDCEKLLKYLIDSPNEILAQLAPDGWKNSPYKLNLYPARKDDSEDVASLNEYIKSLMPKSDVGLEHSIFQDFMKEMEIKPKITNPYEEFLDLFGAVLWCIFSNNHEVFDENEYVYDIGSFRGSGGFIADFLNKSYPSETSFGYMDFYCADMRFDDDTALPLFVLIFEKLKAKNCNWRYSFPKISIISFDKPEEEISLENYDPSKAIEEELAQKQKQVEVQKLRDELDEIYENEREDAKYEAPPLIIRAYQAVYGAFPDGWVH